MFLGGGGLAHGLVDRRMVALVISVFTVMLGFGVVTPILPNYVKSFGVSHTVMGLFVASYGIVRLFMDIPSGHLSDRYGRKPTMIAGLGLFLISGVMAGLAENLELLLFSRVLQGLGASLFTSSAMAHVADIAPKEKRVGYMSQFESGFFLGTAMGPAFGGIIADLGGARASFFALSILSLVSLLFTHFFIVPSKSGGTKDLPNIRETGRAIFGTLRTLNGAILGISGLVLFATIAGVRLTAIPVFGKLALGMSETGIGLVISIYAVMNLVGLLLLGRVSDRMDRKKFLSLSFTITALGVGAHALAKDFLGILLAASVFGFGTSLILPFQQALTLDRSDDRHRGLSLGVFRTFNDMGIVLGPMLSGTLFDTFSLTAPFLAFSAVCLATALLTLGLKGTRHPSTAEH